MAPENAMKVLVQVMVIPVEPKKLSKTDTVSCIFNNTKLDCLSKFLPELGIFALLLSRNLFIVLTFITFQKKQKKPDYSAQEKPKSTEKRFEMAPLICNWLGLTIMQLTPCLTSHTMGSFSTTQHMGSKNHH
jgi:hypothetical protein